MSTLILEEDGLLTMTGDASITFNRVTLKDLHTREDLDHMIFSAFRYALGRRTYIVWTTVEFIINNIDLVPKRFRDLMIKEITEAEENHNNGLYKALGDDCDVKQWLRLREFLKKQ